jgi:hypothetical protein
MGMGFTLIAKAGSRRFGNFLCHQELPSIFALLHTT